MRTLLFFALALIAVSCANNSSEEQVLSAAIPQSNSPEASPSPESAPKYPGVSLEEVFPLLHSSTLLDEDRRETKQSVEIEGFTLKIADYVPLSLSKAGITPFKFNSRKREGYWATAAGVSHLTGPDSKQIYLVVSGPGAVCCTNYSIIDISSKQPRTIFHSEDFGHFRDPMEIFDADGDGIYELAQFDSCMRYFRDDCGACSPEPRAYFKYREDMGKYWPAKSVVQDFVRDQLAQSEKWMGEKYEEWKSTKDLTLQNDLRRAVVAHIVDLLHIGEESRAWATFKRYRRVVDNADRTEIKKRLADCRFYNVLRSST